MRRKKNTIHGIYDNSGTWVDLDAEIEPVFLDYIAYMFRSNALSDSQREVMLEGIHPIISPHMNSKLLLPFYRGKLSKP